MNPRSNTDAAVQGLGVKGPILIGLPKCFGAPEPFHNGWVRGAAPIEAPPQRGEGLWTSLYRGVRRLMMRG